MATATKFMLVLITLVAMAFNVQVSDITEDNLRYLVAKLKEREETKT